MRLYVDEDVASHELLRRLSAAGHDVIPTVRGASDAAAWSLAQERQAVLLTMNARDFELLAAATPGHHGLLLVKRTGDVSQDMRAADIAAAVGNVERTYGEAKRGQVLVLNQSRW